MSIKTSKQGKAVAEQRWGNRYEMLKELSKYISKEFLDEVQSKWKTTHIERLLDAYRFGRRDNDVLVKKLN